MLSESNLIDQVNPFLSNMPGAWSNPYPFAGGYMNPEEEQFQEQDESPACDMASSAGDRQVSWCNPGTPNCPMARELEPTQRVDTDISYKDRGDVIIGSDLGTVTSSNKIDQQFIINIILLLIIIFIAIKLFEKL
jgi:hypothetical protein